MGKFCIVDDIIAESFGNYATDQPPGISPLASAVCFEMAIFPWTQLFAILSCSCTTFSADLPPGINRALLIDSSSSQRCNFQCLCTISIRFPYGFGKFPCCFWMVFVMFPLCYHMVFVLFFIRFPYRFNTACVLSSYVFVRAS